MWLEVAALLALRHLMLTIRAGFGSRARLLTHSRPIKVILLPASYGCTILTGATEVRKNNRRRIGLNIKNGGRHRGNDDRCVKLLVTSLTRASAMR